MKWIRPTLLVGILTVVSVILVIIGVQRSNHGVGGSNDTWHAVAWFGDVTGLGTITKVTLAGYNVGQIEDLQLVGDRVKVVIRLRQSVVLHGGLKDAEGNLRNAAALRKADASLLGDYVLELTPGAAGPVLHEGDEIPLVNTTTAMQAALAKLDTASEIIPKISKIASDIGKITDAASKVLGTDEGTARFQEIADNLVKTSRELALIGADLRGRLSQGALGTGGDLDRGLHDFAAATANANKLLLSSGHLVDKTGESLNRSLANIEKVTETVRNLVGRHGDTAGDAITSVQDTLTGVQKTLNRVDAVVAKLEIVAGRVERGEGNVGRLLKDETLVRKGEAILEDAKSLIERYTRLETGIDYKMAGFAGLHNGPDALRWQSHLSLRLQMREDRYVIATASGDNLGSSSATTRLTQTTAGNGTATSSVDRITDTTNALKFGVQYARRFGPLVLRGGMLESTAGGGADLYLWSDRVIVSADVFRFTQGPRPRVRGSLTWRFLPFLYVWAGGDELLYPSSRMDFFGGMGLAFTDNDLKILFAAAPSVSTK